MAGAQDRAGFPYSRVRLGGTFSLTTTSTSTTAQEPSGISIPLLQRNRLTAGYAPAEIWRPVGIDYLLSTDATTDVTVQLQRNGSAPDGPLADGTDGTATIPAAVTGGTGTIWNFAAFTDYEFTADDAAGDRWGIVVTTAAQAVQNGAAGETSDTDLVFAIVDKLGITMGIPI
jgi:hypothetical protein